jgi:hypothetical protein
MWKTRDGAAGSCSELRTTSMLAVTLFLAAGLRMKPQSRLPRVMRSPRAVLIAARQR